MTTTLQTEMIDQIRPLFIKWNQGTAPSDYIENLWAKMSQENLELALGNFTRMAEDSEDSEIQLPLSYDQREELIVSLAEIQVQSMDLESLKLFYLEKQIECYEYNYTDEQLLSEMKDCVGEEEFTQFVGDLGN